MSSNPMFVTWQDGDVASLTAAQVASGEAYASMEPLTRSSAGYGRDLKVRYGMDREDYEVFRPGEAIPRKRKEILSACLSSYKRVSPIRNIFDMFTDFTTQGIKLVHPNPSGQRYFDNWAKQVRFYERSQHFIDNLQLLGTAVVTREYAKVDAKLMDELQKGTFTEDDEGLFDAVPNQYGKMPKNIIPWSYNFHCPSIVKVTGGELGRFAGKTGYALEIPPTLLQKLRNPINEEDIALFNSLPEYVRRAVESGKDYIPLDSTQVAVFHYKKRDWDDWADPILLSVMDDIVLLQKMKLTDLAALDGAISHIRIWKLGSLEHKMMPTKAAFEKLDNVLRYAGNGQSIDLMWGPDLTMEEKTSDIYKYLGQEKYAPILSSIFSGLGVPPSLVGGGGGDKGFTNNSLSLKTLVERLNYGRQALVEFWDHEIKMVQKALRLRFPAKVEFKHAVLTDEAAYNSLLIDMLDRDVIPVSVMREHLGFTPDIQEAIVRSEWRARVAGRMANKAGPFHDPEQDFSYKKIFAQSGSLTPSELGIELKPRKKGETPALEMKGPSGDGTSQPKRVGVQYQGRPKNSKDTTPRKVKTVVPRTKADGSEFVNLTFWTKEAQDRIAKILSPVYLSTANKQNLRQLTNDEVEQFEHLKFVVLCNLEPYQEINESILADLLKEPLLAHPKADDLWKVLVARFIEDRGVQPTIDDIRQIQCYVYALYKVDYEVL